MAYRRFHTNCLLRVLLLAVSIGLLAYLAIMTTLYATMIVVLLIVAYQIYALIRFVEVTNRSVSRFLDAIEYSDFSDQLSTGLHGRSFDELNASFARVSQRFRELRLEREENYNYLQTVIQHVGIGLLAFREDGRIELINNAACRLLHISNLSSIDKLDSVSTDLADRLRTSPPGQVQLVRVHNGSEPQQLSLLTTQLNLRDRRITLASFQNITTELSAKEMDAWENLIRVLTHEIRNSLTPISSLAATVEESFRKEESDRFSLRQSDREDMFEALSTIRRRSDGLLGFVDSYRRLTRISKPSLTTVNVDDLLSDTTKLMQSEFKNRTVKLSHETIPKDLTIIADSQLSSQVLVNLVKNAIEAIGEQAGGEVHIRAFQDNYGHARITVTDNGPGIVPEALDQIFVPLYTTKKGGSGIGLSLSRQIMRLHHGGLTVSSDPGRETVFAMIF